jgi:uncharacterized protein YdaU (DUF1376 family)
MAKKLPYLPLWTKDFIADTHYLTPAEVGAYVRLLLEAWNQPDCSLPDDDTFLRRVVGGDPRSWRKMKPNVMRFWQLNDGHYRQKRLSSEHKNAASRSRSASKSAKAKWLKFRENEDASAQRTHSERSALTESILQKEKEEERINRKKSISDEEIRFLKWYESYPRKVGKGRARTAYIKALKKTTGDILLKGSERYAGERAGEDQSFTKHPSTWLNSECWDDDPAPQKGNENEHGFTALRRGSAKVIEEAEAIDSDADRVGTHVPRPKAVGRRMEDPIEGVYRSPGEVGREHTRNGSKRGNSSMEVVSNGRGDHRTSTHGSSRASHAEADDIATDQPGGGLCADAQREREEFEALCRDESEIVEWFPPKIRASYD